LGGPPSRRRSRPVGLTAHGGGVLRLSLWWFHGLFGADLSSRSFLSPRFKATSFTFGRFLDGPRIPKAAQTAYRA